MSKKEEYIARVREVVFPDIITGDDGYKVWWPTKMNGSHTEVDLRIIADYLEELNKDWDDDVKAYFASQR